MIARVAAFSSISTRSNTVASVDRAFLKLFANRLSSSKSCAVSSAVAPATLNIPRVITLFSARQAGARETPTSGSNLANAKAIFFMDADG